ncbi:AraC-like DNA-binding protein [Anseongella ginsenosidimutans]|uniref:AraC-like DNA-binding protein n=1 Tax=Anseongella ginsenosidimutans TaxID=496056 RepID=A0A4R3KMT6_9SPHI|nr:AraC family transcriptional regulator [Anseongella ginsenosidimutans]TCS84934.1 AraC-like DNA-binding protein [Anseongella ginsenosidimutans]
MKAILQKVPVSPDSSFAVQEFRSSYFDVPWHFHPEYELVLVIKSEGKRFVGDHIANFAPGDLVLLGSNLPHWYRNDAAYYQNDPNLEAVSIVVQFTRGFIGDAFLQSPEAQKIRQLFDRAAMGLEIGGEARDRVSSMMKEFHSLEGMNKLLQLLTILNHLASSGECSALSHQQLTKLNIEDSKRINKIYEYVMQHFTEPISTEDVSNQVNMCSAAFCRYFKKRTQKTFITFLNEIRVGHACRLLANHDLHITEICYKSGYNNVSHFNRQFKALKNMTPQAFRKHHFNNF